MSEVETEASDKIEIFIKPITTDSSLEILFSEKLKIPPVVKTLLDTRADRQLS